MLLFVIILQQATVTLKKSQYQGIVEHKLNGPQQGSIK